jgi:hypothetical protein
MIDETELEKWWAILNYEIQMYCGVTDLQLAHSKPSNEAISIEDAIMTSGLTEVKVLHVRVLAEMFLDRKFPDDLNIDDLIPTWRVDNSELLTTLRQAYEGKLDIGESPKYYLDKYLAHATKPRGRSFDWKPITWRMDPIIKTVLATLPAEKLSMVAYFKKRNVL